MTKKIAISLPDHLVEAAQRAVACGTATSVSAYIAHAVEQKAKEETLEELLAEMLAATGGPMTDGERAEIDAEMGW